MKFFRLKENHSICFRGRVSIALIIFLVVFSIFHDQKQATSSGHPLVTTRVSVSSTGVQGNSDSQYPSVSANGQFVAFYSTASNLVANDTNNKSDIFVRDIVANTTVRASLSSTGLQGNKDSYLRLAISDDGRFVVFTSWEGLVPVDFNSVIDVYVRDLVNNTTRLVSVSNTGGIGNGHSGLDVGISSDGRLVAFVSYASNLVPGDTNGLPDVFVRDLVNNTTKRISVAFFNPDVGADGGSFGVGNIAANRYVVFSSFATNMAAGDTNGKQDVFVRDLVTNTNTRLSVSSGGVQGNEGSFSPRISADGRFVAFTSDASNLVAGDTNAQSDVFVRDLVDSTTRRVSVSSTGVQANVGSSVGKISADGRFVTFDTSATNLVAGDTNVKIDVFVHDLQTGATNRVSLTIAGGQANDHSVLSTISADGKFVVFVSDANNLVSGDTNGRRDVFITPNSLARTPPVVGFTVDNVIPPDRVSQAIDGTGDVWLSFRIKQQDSLRFSLKDFGYSIDGGAIFTNVPINSGALTVPWPDNLGDGFPSAPTFNDAPPHSIGVSTKHPDLGPLNTIDSNQARFRFKATNPNTGDSNFVITDPFPLDNKAPVILAQANIESRPISGGLVRVTGSFTETHPYLNQFQAERNIGGYGPVASGQANTAAPIPQDTQVASPVDGDDLVTKVKLRHQDALGNFTINENTNLPFNLATVKPLPPAAPTVTTVSVSQANVKINPNAGEQGNVRYSIKFVSNPTQFVQANGSLGATSVFQTRDLWGGDAGVTATGLTPSTQYTISATAQNPNGDNVESDPSPAVIYLPNFQPADPNVFGFAWTETIGWISHNKQDTGSATLYGVKLEANNTFSGYAWSGNIGWVDWKPQGPHPAAAGNPGGVARFDPITGQLSGFAKILALGDNGWISLKGTNYGVTVDQAGGLHGYAWNPGSGTGWIDFDPRNDATTDVRMGANTKPNTPKLIKPVANVSTCVSDIDTPLNPILDWNDFSDPNPADTQQTYQLQVDDNSDFSSLVIDFSPVSSSASAYTIQAGDNLQYNTAYFWRVRVKDNGALWSDFGASGVNGELNQFRTPPHQLPTANFSFNPDPPPAQQEIQFDATPSQAFGGSTINYWKWNFGDGSPVIEGSDPDTHKKPKHTYSQAGTKNVTLRVKDSDDCQAEINRSLNIAQPLPEFRRIIPR